MAKAERLVLVDGSWLIYRAFFAIPANLQTKTGLPTNAIFGFATMFRKLFSGRMPERGAVVFDTSVPTHRELKYPQYKAQRPSMPGELAQQLPVIEVVIVAGDKDLAQMVGDGIRMQDTMRDVTYDAELVRKKWGVPPAQIADLLALMGDTVDNIPGVPGIGQKGAAGLLEKYGSLDGVYAHIEELKGKQKAALEEHREAVKLWRHLATVDDRAALEVDLEALRLVPPDPKELDALYRELEFFSLLTGGGSDAKVGDAPDIEVEVPATVEAARAAIGGLPAGQAVAVVPLYEPPTRVHHAHLVGVAIATAGKKPLYLAFRGPSGALGDPAIELLGGLLGDPSRPKYVHDLKQLVILAWRHGLTLGGELLDTMIASFLVDPVKCIPHGLDQVAREYVQRSIPAVTTVLKSGKSARLPSAVEVAAAATYAAQLADVVLALGPVLQKRLGEAGQTAHYEAVERPLAYVLARMELAGIRVDRDDLTRMGEEFHERKAEIEARIYALAGREFNIGSTKQLADVLFEELKLPVIKKNKTGYSTDAEVLERLAPKHEIAREILAQRELAKLINTYTDVLRDAIAPETGPDPRELSADRRRVGPAHLHRGPRLCSDTPRAARPRVTDLCPVDLGAYSSRITLMVGNACLEGAQRLRRKVCASVAKRWGIPRQRVTLAGRMAIDREDPSRHVDSAQAFQWAEADHGLLGETGSYNTPKDRHGEYRGGTIGASPAYSFTAHVAEVEVDAETGLVEVKTIWIAHDCGKALSRKIVEGQIEGSTYMGFGEALMERHAVDPAHRGVHVGPSFLDYRMPTFLDTPDLEAMIVEAPDANGPYGAKEAGEGPLHSSIPAIANAIYDAVGVRLDRLPFTPQTVLAALRQREEKERAGQLAPHKPAAQTSRRSA
ncbi:DNA polymerase [Nannocystis sp. ILAH1]|uniref:DNA polymerase n=1 Tax=Nannocystis sp. ILAH1 TaxID=2996789 RepID=UPI0022717CD7|nr:DNA polymerase [Nannocystis sp. ILAH1]MCY0988167.1 DNA polymerase [Nannocystis sp. ILAH1]